MTTPATSASDSTRRKRLGDIAIEKGLITRPQLEEALLNQIELQRLGLSERIGTILFKKKLITQTALKEMLREQAPSVRRLGNFEIGEKIGQGAMGVVFRARQISMDRTVALKILAPKYANDPAFIERFVREARAAGQFNHEHIVTAVDVGYAEPYHYFAMEYVEGITLRKVIKDRGALPEKEALRLVLQVAKALEHALDKNIIHRDVKPENIMLTKNGIAKLLDMGLACAAGTGTEEDEGAEENASNAPKSPPTDEERKAVGTPHYISPEAARGEEDLDTRTDIYSLGCTLYHLLIGAPPFRGTQGREVMARHLTDPVPDVRRIRPELSAAVSRVTATMMAKTRDERYTNPAQLIEDLEALMSGKNPPHLAAKKRLGHTTGPKTAVSPRTGTTGPRTPIGPRGTTGPRAAIQPPEEKGSLAPAPGDRTGAAAAVGSWRRGQRLWIGAAAGFFLLLLGGLAFLNRGSNPEVVETGGLPPVKGVEKGGSLPSAPMPVPAAAAIPDMGGPMAPAPAPASVSIREELAKDAAESARALQKERPEDYAAQWLAFERAVNLSPGSPGAAALQETFKAVQSRWAEAYAAALKKVRAAVRLALEKEEFAGALAACADPVIPDPIRAGDWRTQLEGVRKEVRDAAEAVASAKLEQARASAAKGDRAGLEGAIGQARAVQAIGSVLAPSAAKAEQECAEWEQRLAEVRKTEGVARQAMEKMGRELMVQVQRDLAPLLAQNRFSAAEELLDRHAKDPGYAAAASLLEQERADLQAVLAIRQRAVEALRARAGETITLKRGPGALTGQVKENPKVAGVTLKLTGGLELTMNAEQLDADDTEAFAPREQGAGQVEDLRRRGLLYLAAGNWAKAKVFVTAARDAGLGNAAVPYLERLAGMEGGEFEAQAARAWFNTEALFKEKRWKDTLQAVTAFKQKFGSTRLAAEKEKELQAFAAASEQNLLAIVPTQGLKVWLRMDEGKGAVLSNALTPGQGAVVKGATWAPGKSGSALNFDGGEHFAMTVDLRAALTDESVTLALWIFPTGAGVAVSELGQPAINNGWHSSQIEVLENGEVKVRVWPLEGLTAGTAAFNQWHHVALRFDKSIGTLEGFLDGVQAAAGVKGERQVPWKQGVPGLHYALGAADGAHMGSGAHFKGLLDEFRVYDRALSPLEIKALALSGAGPNK